MRHETEVQSHIQVKAGSRDKKQGQKT